MRAMRHAGFVLLALTIAAVGCAAPPRPATSAGSSPSGSEPARSGPKKITVGIQSEPAALSSKIRLLGVGIAGVDALEELANAGLTHETAAVGSLEPQIAEAVPTIENGLWTLMPDGRMETTWRIKAGAAWHDGVPFTSDDLVFTGRVIRDRELGVFREAAYDKIEAVAAPDDRTVTVTWKQPFIKADSLFTYELALPLPRHLLEKPYLEDKAGFTQVPYWTDEFVGTGAYVVRQWVRGSHTLLEANPAYVLGRPKIDQIEVRFIPSSPTLAANILAGAVEMTLGRSLSLEQSLGVRDQWREGRMYTGFSSTILIYVQFVNPSPPVIGDARFRRALMHAMNRQEMADTLQAGLVPVAHSFLGSSAREYEEVQSALIRYDYDPARALRMIEGLGYATGGAGGIRDAAGQRLTVEIRTSQGDDLQEKATFSAADYWGRIGLGVDTVLVTPQQAEGREYRANYPGFDIRRQPDDLGFLDRLDSSKAPLPTNNYVGNNYSRYMNPSFDTLLDRFSSTIPRAQRTQVLGQILHQMTDEVTVMPLFYNTSPTMIGNRLLRVTDRSDGPILHPWNVHDWDVR